METNPRSVTVETIRFAARDGRPLEGDLHHPAGTPRANVVVHGATAVPRRHYTAFAAHLADAGYRVLIYDYRGVGGSVSGHPRSDRATMTDWIEQDAPAAVDTLTKRDRSVPLLAVGHSFGGQVAAALERCEKPLAIATTGAQRGYWATFPWHERPRMFLNCFVLLPLVSSTFGYVPGAVGLGEDMPAGIVTEWAKWCKSPEYFLTDHPELGIRMRAYDGRLLALSVTDDAYASLGNVEWLIDRHESAHREHVRFEPRDAGSKTFGHFGFFRRGAVPTVWPEILGFFDETLGDGSRPNRLGRTTSGTPVSLAIDERDALLDLAHGRS